MEGLQKFKQMILKLAGMKIVRILVGILLALFLVIWVYRGCTHARTSAPVYRIARSSTWPALDLMGKEPNMQGFLDDLITEIAQDEKIAVIIVTLIQKNLFEELNADNYDGILTVVTPDPLMHEHYAISDPIFMAGPVLIVQKSSKATSLKDMENNGIGIRNNSPFLFKLNQNPNLTFVPFDNMFTALEELSKGNLAGVIMEAQMAHTFIKSFYADKLRVVGSPLADVSIRLVTHWDKKGEYLIQRFNSGLKKLHEDGTFDQLVKKWTLIK